MEYVKQEKTQKAGDVHICPLCGKKALHVLGNQGTETKQCIHCGYATSDRFKHVPEEDNEAFESLTEELQNWAQLKDGYIWIPSFITLPFGMLYPFNNEDNEMKWAVAEMIDIPEDEQQKYPIPNQEGKFYTQKFDTDNAKTFDEFLYAMHEINEKAKSLEDSDPNFNLNINK